MSTADHSLAAKKRIMFIMGEDFNFLTYNILITLDALQCNVEKKAFIDHRKLAYLVDLVSSPILASILERFAKLGTKLNKKDVHALSVAYTNGASRKHFVTRIINSLCTRGMLRIARGSHDLDLKLWLNPDAIPASFLTSELYILERENLTRLKAVSKQIRILTFPTFLDKFFQDQGVRTWHSSL